MSREQKFLEGIKTQDGKSSIEDCKKIFDFFDGNHDDVLENHEARLYLGNLWDLFQKNCKKQYHEQQQERFIASTLAIIDKDGDGRIKWDDLCLQSSAPEKKSRLQFHLRKDSQFLQDIVFTKQWKCSAPSCVKIFSYFSATKAQVLEVDESRLFLTKLYKYQVAKKLAKLSKQQQREAAVDEMMQRLDTNGDGKLSWNELVLLPAPGVNSLLIVPSSSSSSSTPSPSVSPSASPSVSPMKAPRTTAIVTQTLAAAMTTSTATSSTTATPAATPVTASTVVASTTASTASASTASVAATLALPVAESGRVSWSAGRDSTSSNGGKSRRSSDEEVEPHAAVVIHAPKSTTKVSIWEYERYMPLPAGEWRTPFLPTDPHRLVTPEGVVVKSLEAVEPQLSATWRSEWTATAWEYALDFKTHFSPRMGPFDHARRRLWERHYAVDEKAVLANQLSKHPLTVRQYLTQIHLPQHADCLLANGFESLAALARAHDSDYVQLGIPLSHWRDIQGKLADLVASSSSASSNDELVESDAIKGYLFKRMAVGKWTKVFCSFRGSELRCREGASGTTTTIELKASLCCTLPFAGENRVGGYVFGVFLPSGEKHFFECESDSQRREWQNVILSCGAGSLCSVDSFDCEFEHSAFIPRRAKNNKCVVEKCLQEVYHDEYCLIHYNLITVQFSPTQWDQSEGENKFCHGCSSPLEQARKAPPVLGLLEKVLKLPQSESKFYCRGCGHLFCSQICRREIPLPKVGFASPVPVCPECAKEESARQFFVTKQLSKLLKGQVMRNSATQNLGMVQLDYDELKLVCHDIKRHEQAPVKLTKKISDRLKASTAPTSKEEQKKAEMFLREIVEVSSHTENGKFVLTIRGGDKVVWNLECSDESVVRAWIDALLQSRSRLLPRSKT